MLARKLVDLREARFLRCECRGLNPLTGPPYFSDDPILTAKGGKWVVVHTLGHDCPGNPNWPESAGDAGMIFRVHPATTHLGGGSLCLSSAGVIERWHRSSAEYEGYFTWQRDEYTHRAPTGDRCMHCDAVAINTPQAWPPFKETTRIIRRTEWLVRLVDGR